MWYSLYKKNINKCVDCNSSNIVFYNPFNRGVLLIIIAIILFPVYIFIIKGSFVISIFFLALILIKGVHMILRGNPYYIWPIAVSSG